MPSTWDTYPGQQRAVGGISPAVVQPLGSSPPRFVTPMYRLFNGFHLPPPPPQTRLKHRHRIQSPLVGAWMLTIAHICEIRPSPPTPISGWLRLCQPGHQLVLEIQARGPQCTVRSDNIQPKDPSGVYAAVGFSRRSAWADSVVLAFAAARTCSPGCIVCFNLIARLTRGRRQYARFTLTDLSHRSAVVRRSSSNVRLV